VRERQPLTQTIKATDVRARWSDVVNKVARKEARVLVEKSGIPVAAIISADDFARLQQFDAERERDFAPLDRVGEAFTDVPAAELEREVSEALAEVRAEDRRAAAKTA